MSWDKPVITDSGGFQVFSMGHGTVADEIKGRAPQFAGERAGRDPVDRGGGRTLPLLSRGSTRFMGPETSMAVQAALGSDIALVFDESPRSTAVASTPRGRPSAPTAGSIAAWPGTPRTARRARSSTGSSRAESRRTCAAPPPRRSPPAGGGIAIGGTLGEDKAQMFEVVGWTMEEFPASGRSTCWASARSTTSCAASSSASTRSTARCRPGSAATAWRSCPTRSIAGAWISPRRAGREADEPLLEGCPCPACAEGYTPRLPALPAARPGSTRRCGCSRSTTSPSSSA